MDVTKRRAWEHPILGSYQSVRIEASVLRHFRRHRQLKRAAREAGAQLLGHVTDQLVIVSQAAGPRLTDERGRYAFRSGPPRCASRYPAVRGPRLLYLGE